jgi:hypothetical protein
MGVVKALVRAGGAALNAKNAAGETAQQLSLRGGHPEVARVLLQVRRLCTPRTGVTCVASVRCRLGPRLAYRYRHRPTVCGVQAQAKQCGPGSARRRRAATALIIAAWCLSLLQEEEASRSRSAATGAASAPLSAPLSAPPARHACAACGVGSSPSGARFKKCARCKAVRYCSKGCQSTHWPVHKASCAER